MRSILKTTTKGNWRRQAGSLLLFCDKMLESIDHLGAMTRYYLYTVFIYSFFRHIFNMYERGGDSV